MNAKEATELIAYRMDSKVWLLEDDEWCESLLRKMVGHEKQNWNKRCNEACKMLLIKQLNTAYEEAAMIANRFGATEAAHEISALKIKNEKVINR